MATTKLVPLSQMSTARRASAYLLFRQRGLPIPALSTDPNSNKVSAAQRAVYAAVSQPRAQNPSTVKMAASVKNPSTSPAVVKISTTAHPGSSTARTAPAKKFAPVKSAPRSMIAVNVKKLAPISRTPVARKTPKQITGGNVKAAVAANSKKAAAAHAKTAAAAKATAQKSAAQAKVALAKGDRRTAGMLVGKQMAAARVALTSMAKAKVAAQHGALMTTAAAHEKQADTLRQQAQEARAANQPAAAQRLYGQAATADQQAAAANQRASAVAAQPVAAQIPPELRAGGVEAAVSKFGIRSKAAGEGGGYPAWIATLSGVGSVGEAWTVALGEYGGGVLGAALTAAEFGHAKAFGAAQSTFSSRFDDAWKSASGKYDAASRMAGLAERAARPTLGDLSEYAPETGPSGIPKSGCVPGDLPSILNPMADWTTPINKFCDCAYPADLGEPVATWNRRCKKGTRIAQPWSQLGRASLALPSPSVDQAAADATSAAKSAPSAPTSPPAPSSPPSTSASKAPSAPAKPGAPSAGHKMSGISPLAILAGILGVGAVGVAIATAAKRPAGSVLEPGPMPSAA